MTAAAACGVLKHHCIFEKKEKTASLPAEHPTTFLESSWTHIDSIETLNLPSFHGQDFHPHHSFCHDSPSSSSMSSANQNHTLGENGANYGQGRQHGRSNSFSSMSFESLSMCTEGLGFESCDDVEEEIGNNEFLQGGEDSRGTTLTGKVHAENECIDNNRCAALLSKRLVTPSTSLRSFPPPISSIGRNGKPWVCFRSFRENGRFILKEIRIPNQEILHSYRENGRFRLQFAGSDDVEILEEDRDEEKEEDEDVKK